MLHVVTVHWQDGRWIEPQLRFLKRFAAGPVRTYAALRGIDSSQHGLFDVAVDLDGTHAQKLNDLAAIVLESADPQDLLLFIDGDAFPIAPITADILQGRPLAAVRRDENVGQCQPHPCFCLTTVGFWRSIAGDWKSGYKWETTTGEHITDTGGNLLGLLLEHGIDWTPLLRSNRVNLDPLLYGVYADLVYHHGAGFRRPLTWRIKLPAEARVRSARDATVVPARIPILSRLERSLRYRIVTRRERRALESELDRIDIQSAEVFRWILDEDDFPGRFADV